ncbi:MAG: thiamine phosphate synthase [Pedobacter sp.]|nr:MAG: thiamine phosphate synthase [Pedobacter sp.]
MEMSTLVEKTIMGGLYLVVNPALELNILLEKLKSALSGGIDVIQIWNNFPKESNRLFIVEEISRLCKPYSIPILINEDWTLLLKTNDIDGIHFDCLPDDLQSIRKIIGRPIITGITCSDDLEIISLANKNGLDYISFCSMYPSSSAASCNIVLPETVLKACKLTKLPIFISGGMTPDNTTLLKKKIPFDGVAVISGILNTENPKQKVKAYQNALKIKN